MDFLINNSSRLYSYTYSKSCKEIISNFLLTMKPLSKGTYKAIDSTWNPITSGTKDANLPPVFQSASMHCTPQQTRNVITNHKLRWHIRLKYTFALMYRRMLLYRDFDECCRWSVGNINGPKIENSPCQNDPPR